MVLPLELLGTAELAVPVALGAEVLETPVVLIGAVTLVGCDLDERVEEAEEVDEEDEDEEALEPPLTENSPV